MALNENSFFNYVEGRGQSGYRGSILVKDPDNGTDGKYSMLVPSTTVPSVFGSSDSFEFDLLNMPTKGKIAGKPSIEAKEVEVLYHRDNAYRFYKLRGKTLNFLVISEEFMAYSFVGTIDYRPNDGSADVWMATYTITPMSAEPTPIFDARPLIATTLNFKNAVPKTVKTNEDVDLSNVLNVAGVSFTVVKIAAETNNETVAVSNTDYEVEGNNISFKTTGLFAVTVSDPAGEHASWTTTIYAEAAA